MTTRGQYLLTVRSADGSVVRRHRYRTCEEAGLSDAVPTLEEMIAGHSGEVRDGRTARATAWGWEPVNPKVLPLVEALLAAGVVTTGSGDLYGDDLVYVDLADGWENAIAAMRMPSGWVATPTLADAARKALGLPPRVFTSPGEPVEGVQDDEDELPGSAVRLSRMGGSVTPQEVADITNSLLSAAGQDP